MMRSILLIDDDRLQCRLTERLVAKFEGERFRLHAVTTYEAGLSELIEGGHAACLLDYQLGARDGLELIKAALAAGTTTPIIFLTAETSGNVDNQALDAGAFDFLNKAELTARSLERSVRYAVKLGETLAELRRLATRDELTGLWNRREFTRLMTEEVARARRFGRALALVMLDIDHFKSINDTHGHPAGDAVLAEVARRLMACSRRTDRIGRYGGEEFALVLVETGLDPGVAQTRRLLERISEEPVALPSGVEITVTASAGVAGLRPDAGEHALLREADEALYRAKAGGRNRACRAGD